MTPQAVYTLGHSSHSYEHLVSLLRAASITALADVRTSPYSRHFPHFNREPLREALKSDGVVYSFLGEELGGRPRGARYYRDGVADYERMAEAPDFEKGVQRVIEGARTFRIALMCSEHDPQDCHRCLLVGRALAGRSVEVRHLLGDGLVSTQHEIEEQLLDLAGHQGDDLFMTYEERLALAYRIQARKVAYAEQPGELPHAAAAG